MNNTNQIVLLMAVPVGYTAADMRTIKTLLWSNPKTLRWWEQQDPLRPKVNKAPNHEDNNYNESVAEKEKKEEHNMMENNNHHHPPLPVNIIIPSNGSNSHCHSFHHHS